MRLGVKATLLLVRRLRLLLRPRSPSASTAGSDRSRRRRPAETVRLLAREQAAILSERTYEALLVRRRRLAPRLRERVEDVVLLSEIVKSVTVVDAQGQVVASDRWRVGETVPDARRALRREPRLRAEPLTDRAFFGGGDYAVSIPFPEGRRAWSATCAWTCTAAAWPTSIATRAGGCWCWRCSASPVSRCSACCCRCRCRGARRRSRGCWTTRRPVPRARRSRGDEFAHALAAASRVRHELTEARQRAARACTRASTRWHRS